MDKSLGRDAISFNFLMQVSSKTLFMHLEPYANQNKPVNVKNLLIVSGRFAKSFEDSRLG